MKKTTLFILLISIFIHISAQQKRFITGLILDLNGIGLLGNTGQYWNSSTENDGVGHGGVSCGIFVKRGFTEKIYSTFEIRYSTKGSYYGYVGQYGTPAWESLYLNYLELPLIFGYKITTLKKNYYLESGLEFSKLVNSKIETSDPPARTNAPSTTDFKGADISWIGCFKFPLIRKWQEHFLFGIRVTRSIPSVHRMYKIYNFEYGIEFNYIFN